MYYVIFLSEYNNIFLSKYAFIKLYLKIKYSVNVITTKYIR